MPNLTCHTPGSALLKGALAVALALPAALWAGPLTIKVPRPNGVDDTANLQAALTAATTHGPGAIVQLAAGTYRTRQLVASNFQGALRGAGQSLTTLVAKANLPVNVPGSPWPLPADGIQWPVLIMFIDGDVRVSDLTISVPAANDTATTGYSSNSGPSGFGLYSAILFTGQYPTNAVVERVTVAGVQDSSLWGYNVAMGVDYSSYYPDTPSPGDTLWLKGNFTVQNCIFRNMVLATSFHGRHQDNQVVIGGSSGHGNVVQNVDVGFDLERAQNAGFEVSFNQVSASMVGMWEMDLFSPEGFSYLPTAPSAFLIHDNTFTVSGGVTGFGPAGIAILDEATSPWTRASIYNNRIAVQTVRSYGILASGTKETSIRSNTITGLGRAGISLIEATLATIEDNRFANFTANTYDITLDGYSSNNRVTCGSPNDTVGDDGANDIISYLPPAAIPNQNQQ